MTTTNLKRDYELIIDKSGSMSGGSGFAGSKLSRWEAVRESAFALATKVQPLDPDGIDVTVFSSSSKTYPNTTPDKVEQVFKENDPSGGTNLAGVLKTRLDAWAADGHKPKTFLVITDGAPDSQEDAADEIVRATKGMDDDSQLGISFLQIGNDPGATSFLKYLDDNLVSAKGAKFDVVDTVTFADIDGGNKSFTDVLLGALDD